MGHNALICRSCGTELDPAELQNEVDDTWTCPDCQEHAFGI